MLVAIKLTEVSYVCRTKLLYIFNGSSKVAQICMLPFTKRANIISAFGNCWLYLLLESSNGDLYGAADIYDRYLKCAPLANF